MKKTLQSYYVKTAALAVLILMVALGTYGGCNGSGNNGDGGDGGMDDGIVTTTLCGSILNSQDSAFNGCGSSISVINDLGLPEINQRGIGEPLGTAYVNIPFTESVANRNFVNAAVDFNQDGEIANYSSDNGSQKEWIVENVPLIIFPFNYNFYFDIKDSNIDTETAYNLIIMASDETVQSADEFNGSIPVDVSFIEGTLGISVFDFVNMVDPDADAFGAGESSTETSFSGDELTSRGTEIMTVDGVDIVVLDGVPDLPQSVNTCVPNSIANSIAWLADTYDFDLMIKEGEDTFNVDLTDLESINNDLLNPFISFVDTNDGFVKDNTGQRRGILPENIKPLKDSFVSMNNIPVNTTLINIDPENPGDLMETLKDRLEEGCIAELLFQMFNAQGQKIGGHVVNMTGYSLGSAFNNVDEFGDPVPGDTSNTKKIVIHDANHSGPPDESGLPAPQNDIYDYNITPDGDITIENYMYGPNGTATVKLVGAVVECVELDTNDTMFELEVTTDGELSIIHKKFVDNCPQPIGTITIKNTGDVEFDWFRLGLLGTKTTPSAGSLKPGEMVTLMVEFTCNPPSDVMGNIRIKAVVGQTEKEFSFPVSVDVQQ